jgi:hypothetical protein
MDGADELQAKVAELERKVQDLEASVERMTKQEIVVVGTFDGTNIPITIQGIRRKIATTTP